MDKIICNICNKQYLPKYMTQHKSTFLHIENCFEYDLDKNVEQNLENYFHRLFNGR